MNWLRSKLIGSKPSREEQLAENLYAALVLDGGPSNASPNHIGSSELEIPLGRLEQFSQKRLISLEALLFVAAQIETAERSKKLQMAFGDSQLHPFALATGRLISKKWQDRGIDIEQFDAGERCFDEVEVFLEKPFRWGREWLDEFFGDPEKSGKHYILWTEQWLKEFEVMRQMVRQVV
ncbi:hypothetical protein [uncultured Aliiroseovarius sp.]|uniref:hypothetical protein n=1 Tax=uncultured Aliiroseovarius sp. TaxID=1658783 RepID=UPI00260DF443|nr:hypothetical protein [uncultured Aliiroseovarius sp.]